MRSETKHIDDVQPATVDEHFKMIMADEDIVDYDPSEEVTPMELPEWFDEELFKAGQDYYSSNLFGITAATFAGVIAILSVPSILKVLAFTKRSGTPCAAFRRYFETMYHAHALYTQDVKDKNSDLYKTLNEIRSKHSNVTRRTLCAGIKGITYRDMAITQFNSIGYALLDPEYLGLTNTPKDREGLVHHWRVVGHMIGIPDRLNMCRKNEAETTELCIKLRDEVFGKYFQELPPNFMEMSKIMLRGTWSMDIAIDIDAFFAFTYKLNNMTYKKPLGTYSWLNLKYRETIHKLCGIPYIGAVVRGYFNYFMCFNYWFLKRWPVVAWLQYGRKNTKVTIYSKH